MADLSKIILPNNSELTLKDNSQEHSAHTHYDSDMVPLIHKKYESTSYYGTTNDWANTSWYFMSVVPNDWYTPWRVKFKIHSYAPSYSSYHSYTWSTVCGRSNSMIYANWNERQNSAHSWIVGFPMKKAGFDAGYGHAIGISIYNADSRTDSRYYRTFEIDYYECENCTVTIFDSPIKWSEWVGNTSTNYEAISSMNAIDRGLQESGDANSQGQYLLCQNYTYFKSAVASETVAGGDSSGYVQLDSGATFNLAYPLLWVTADIAANSANYANTYLMHYDRNISKLKSGFTSAAKKLIYLVLSSISGTTATVDTTVVTDTLPDTEDGKYYMVLGKMGNNSNGQNYFIFLPNHPIFRYINGQVRNFVSDADTVGGHTVAKDVPANAVFTDTTYNAGTGIQINNNTISTKDAEIAPYEEKLQWGGGSRSGSVGPVGMAMSSEHSANRLAFINPNALKFEYSSDDGVTWIDYGIASADKPKFCTEGWSLVLPIGRPDTTTEITLQSKTRVTISANDAENRYLYTSPKKLLVNVSTPKPLSLLIERRTGANFLSDGPWVTVGTYTVAGWSGWSDVPLYDVTTLGGSLTQTTNNWQLRLTFSETELNPSYLTSGQIQSIRLYGDNDWYLQNNLAKTGHLYSFDAAQNATFPANLTAKGNIKMQNGKQVAYYSSTPTNNQVAVADGNTGAIKNSGYTIYSNVPANAKFTDTTYTFTGGENKITVTPSGGTAADVNITVDDDTKLPLAGGTLTGDVFITRGTDTQRKFGFLNNSDKFGGLKLNNSGNNIDFGWDYDSVAGSGAYFRGVGFSSSYGEFGFFARHTNGTVQLVGRSNGALTWNNKRVVTATNSTQIGSATKPVYVDSSGYVTECSVEINTQKIFVDTVTTPYAVGDVWLGSDGTFQCIDAKASGDFDIEDWEEIPNGYLNTEEVSALINQNTQIVTGNGSILWHDSNNDGKYDEILLIRNDNTADPVTLSNATSVYKFYNNGLYYSSTGYNGTYSTILTPDGKGVADFLQYGTLDASKVNIINFNSSMITAGLLKRGGTNNDFGEVEVYNALGVLIGKIDNAGFTFYGAGQVGQRPYIKINDTVGFAGYDAADNIVFQVVGDEFRAKKMVVSDEISIGGKLKFLPITIMEGSTAVNDGVAIVGLV